MPAEPYSVLAAGYDQVMDHVDYDAWAAYVHALLRRYGEGVTRVVELGGGTGSLAVRLQPMGNYEYVLTDGAPAMLNQARAKIDEVGASIRCVRAHFTTVTPQELGLDDRADAVVLVYDGLNYLLDPSDVAVLLAQVHGLLRPGGLAVVDQSTPANAQTPDARFDDEGAADGFAYVRETQYDPETRRHETAFTLTVDGRTVTERHVQRAYTMDEMRTLIQNSPLTVAGAYEGVTTEPARDDSPRVHWVLRRPAD